MFKKWNPEEEGMEVKEEKTISQAPQAPVAKKPSGANTILKGSKLIGDINVTCDLELSGDIEGNIRSTDKSNIAIMGTCKGNIETKDGNVNIEGALEDGNIIAGSDVRINGRFSGGEVRAKGKIYINGEFNGKLEGNEVEIGPDAKGTGEILYKEFISIARGARIDGQISQAQKELKLVKNTPEENKNESKPPVKEAAVQGK